MNKKEKQEIASRLYKVEEDRWNNINKAYYQPKGAPGRLSRELLEQHHKRHNTGIKPPDEYDHCLVQVWFGDRSFSIKRFLTKHGARQYVDALQDNGVKAAIVNNDSESLLREIMINV